MKRLFLLPLFILAACNQPVEKVRGVPAPAAVEVQKPSVDEQARDLKDKGYQTFMYEEGDTTFLMQQYYIVFLKAGKNRSQDSTEVTRLQQEHMAHLSRMYKEGFSSLTGPMGDDGELRGIVIYNTATLREADSLAKLDPMVQAGRLEVEVKPWWTAKGGKLN
ncbi:MAG TPA: YciI family protein [Gillisia sp.]|nr:YciI family protein [Gillisia sp.]